MRPRRNEHPARIASPPVLRAYVDRQNTTEGRQEEGINTYLSRNRIFSRKLCTSNGRASQRLNILVRGRRVVYYKEPTLETEPVLLCASALHSLLYALCITLLNT